MEQEIINAVALVRSPAATVVAKWITFLGEWWVLLIAVFVLCLLLVYQKRIWAALAFGAGYVVLLVIVYALKDLIRRPRPTGALIEDSLFSFPSAHAALATYFFCMTALLFAPRIKHPIARMITFVALFSAPLIVAFTRLYFGVHFLTDILAGLLLGGAVVFLALKASKVREDAVIKST